jgi:23S rRNA pseudouridine2605 synthase
MVQERIHKCLARAGVASRRAVERMIREGRVRLNNKPLTELGTIVDTEKDVIYVNGEMVPITEDLAEERVYFLLNKPAGVVSTAKDDRDRLAVTKLIKGVGSARIFPVGRLDYDAEGALILTNDGDLMHQLLHPKKKVPKVYMVKVKGEPTESHLDLLRRGVYLEDGPTGPSKITVVKKARVNTWVEVILTEGKNRQIKRMFWRIGNPVQKLIRTHFAGLSVEGLRPGEYRSLSKRELTYLRDQSK